MVCHLENTADVGRLALVEEELGRRCVVVTPVAAFEKLECHQGVEKIARRTRMQTQPFLQRFEVPRIFR
jgi:hypothetical protein